MSNKAWNLIFNELKITNHNFDKSPFYISSKEIKEITKIFTKTADREVRIICKQDSREARPEIFKELNLFILPIKNGDYVILKGDGYIDINNLKEKPFSYISKLDFELETVKIGNSEMQHLDFAYASSIIRTFCDDKDLVLTIRGRKYTPEFDFNFNNHKIYVKGVQTEVDAGYESRNKIVLIEAKNSKTQNIIIRQIFYPFRQWQQFTNKKVIPLFFEKRNKEYCIWQYDFTEKNDYSSIKLIKSAKFYIE